MIIKPLKHGYYQVYFDFNPTESEIAKVLYDNKLRFIRKDNGIFKKYPVVILAEKI